MSFFAGGCEHRTLLLLLLLTRLACLLLLVRDLICVLVHTEAEDARDVGFLRRYAHLELRESQEEEMSKGGAKESAIDGVMARGTRSIDFIAARAVQLDTLLIGCIGQTNGYDGLSLAVYSRAETELRLAILLIHLLQSMRRENVACMDQAIQILSIAFDRLLLILGVLGHRLSIQDHVESSLVVWYLGLQTSEIEHVLDEGLLNLAEELVRAKLAEPSDPGLGLNSVPIAVLRVPAAALSTVSW